MASVTAADPTAWLLERGGPSVRYLTARDLLDARGRLDELRATAAATPTVQRCLGLLGTGPVHHGREHSSENVLWRLLQLGVERGEPTLDRRVAELVAADPDFAGPTADKLAPLLVAFGYHRGLPALRDYVDARIAAMRRAAADERLDVFLSRDEKRGVPTPWRDQNIYRSAFSPIGDDKPLPMPAGFLLAAWYPADGKLAREADAVVDFVLGERYRALPGPAYIWARELRRCWAADRFHPPDLDAIRRGEGGGRLWLVLTLEALVHRRGPLCMRYLAAGIDLLRAYATTDGRYRFPRDLLRQDRDGYYFLGYQMGLGEDRKRREALELESTLRLLRLLRRAPRRQEPKLP